MARLNHSNTAVRTSLSSAINSTDTSLTVSSASGYPATPFAIGIGDEVIQVGAKSGTTFSTLTRGYDGTTAASHAAGSAVLHRGINEDFEEAYKLFDTVTAAAGTLPTSDGSSVTGQAPGSDNQVLITDTAQGDNLLWQALSTLLENAILTTNGDILIRNGSGNVVRLGVGNDDQILGSSGSVPQWENKPWHVIDSEDISSQGVIDLTGMDSTYEHYRILVSGVTAGGTNATFQINFFDGGSEDTETNYNYTEMNPSGADANENTTTGGDRFNLGVDPTHGPITGTIDVNRTGGDPGIAWRLGHLNEMSIGFGEHGNMGNLTGVRIDSGNTFDGGRVTLFGIPHS